MYCKIVRRITTKYTNRVSALTLVSVPEKESRENAEHICGELLERNNNQIFFKKNLLKENAEAYVMLI